MDKQPLTPEDISKIVSGLDPIDWVQLELLAKLPPQKRLIPGLVAQEFAMATFERRVRRNLPCGQRIYRLGRTTDAHHHWKIGSMA